MKSVHTKLKRFVMLGAFISFITAAPAYGQVGQLGRIEMSHLDRFADTADKVISVDISEGLIKLAMAALNPDRSPNEKKIKEILEGLKGIYVKRFQFDKEGGFSMADVESIRSQLGAPGWEKIANVRSKNEGNYDVVMMYEGSIVKGLAVVAAEPRALTVVNIVGTIDVAKFRELQGSFGIPNLGLDVMPGVTIKDNRKDKQPDNDPQDQTVVQVTTEKREEKKPPKLIRPDRPPQE
jgi:Domain of unknown function (DUF4252)